MNLFVLLEKQKKYPWIRPKSCPCCKSKRLWGHGYTLRYFDEIDDPVPLKRWRCPDCGAVHTIRPTTYSEGFSSLKTTHFKSISEKISRGRWLSDISRQKQQYWYKGFKRQINKISISADEFQGLRFLASIGRPLATHSIKQFVKHSTTYTPYLILAATGEERPP
jgi:hypothetical protein